MFRGLHDPKRVPGPDLSDAVFHLLLGWVATDLIFKRQWWISKEKIKTNPSREPNRDVQEARNTKVGLVEPSTGFLLSIGLLLRVRRDKGLERSNMRLRFGRPDWDISCVRLSSLNPLGSFIYLFFYNTGLGSCYVGQAGILAPSAFSVLGWQEYSTTAGLSETGEMAPH